MTKKKSAGSSNNELENDTMPKKVETLIEILIDRTIKKQAKWELERRNIYTLVLDGWEITVSEELDLIYVFKISNCYRMLYNNIQDKGNRSKYLLVKKLHTEIYNSLFSLDMILDDLIIEAKKNEQENGIIGEPPLDLPY